MTAGAILSEGIRGPAGTVSTIARQTIGDFGISEQDLLQDPTVVNVSGQSQGEISRGWCA